MGNFNLDTDEQNDWYKISTNQSSEHLGDCLEIMPLIKDKSIDMILADLPYGTTSCKWDSLIPFHELWKEYKRIIKPNGSIVLTGSQPFTSLLVNSNIEWFRYSLIWEKERPSNPAHAKFRFMKWHEDILIFAQNRQKFNPQKEIRLEKNKRNNKQGVFHKSDVYGQQLIPQGNGMENEKYLSSVLKVNVERGLHPTQKPTKLFEILIRSFTNEGDIVLDNTAGVFTTAIACLKTKRKYIVIEKDKEYFNKGIKRIIEFKKNTNLFS